MKAQTNDVLSRRANHEISLRGRTDANQEEHLNHLRDNDQCYAFAGLRNMTTSSGHEINLYVLVFTSELLSDFTLSRNNQDMKNKEIGKDLPICCFGMTCMC